MATTVEHSLKVKQTFPGPVIATGYCLHTFFVFVVPYSFICGFWFTTTSLIKHRRRTTKLMSTTEQHVQTGNAEIDACAYVLPRCYPWFSLGLFVVSVGWTKLLSARIRMTQFMSVTTQTSIPPNRVREFESRNLWCLLTKSCWNVNTGKMLRILVPLMCVKFFFFGFFEALDLKRILNKP